MFYLVSDIKLAMGTEIMVCFNVHFVNGIELRLFVLNQGYETLDAQQVRARLGKRKRGSM